MQKNAALSEAVEKKKYIKNKDRFEVKIFQIAILHIGLQVLTFTQKFMASVIHIPAEIMAQKVTSNQGHTV